MHKKARGVFVVLNEKGLHTRPSTELVKTAAHYRAQIYLSYRNSVVNAKSLLGILMLAAERGAKIVIDAIGDDAEDAVQGLMDLAKSRFHVKY